MACLRVVNWHVLHSVSLHALPCGCHLTYSRAVCLHQTCNVVRLVVSSRCCCCCCCGAVDLVVSTSVLLWRRLSVLLCQSLWYLVVAAGLLLGSTLWYSCRFRSNVKVPSSVTSLSCLSLARLPSSRNCFSKGVKPERFQNVSRTFPSDCF